MRELDN